jgi:hypothetical protein
VSPLRVALSAAVVLTSLVVQLTVLSRLALPGATPDLVLVAVVGLALAGGPGSGLLTGAAAGLATDLVPPASVLLYAATGVLIDDPLVPSTTVIRLVPTAVLYDVLLSPFIVPAVLAVDRRVEPDRSTRS